MGIVGDDQRQAGFTSNPLDALIDGPLLFNTVILQFQIEPIRTEDFSHLQRVVLRRLIVLFHQILRDRAGQTGRSGNQALVVFLQKFHIHAGLAVKTTGKCFGNQQTQIFVTLTVLTQQHQMVRIVVYTVDAILHLAPRKVDLAADDGFDSRSFGSFIEINAAIHNTVICDRDGSLPQLFDPVHHTADAAGTVKEGVFCMDMQMYKTH